MRKSMPRLGIWWVTITLAIVAPIVAAVVVVLMRLDQQDLSTLSVILLVLLAVVIIGLLFIGLIASLAVVLRKLLADDQAGDLKEMVIMSKLFQPQRVTNQYRPVAGYPPQQQFQHTQLPPGVQPGAYEITDLVGDNAREPTEIDLE